MLQQDEPEDFVIATGETHSVREFVELAFKEVGIKISWEGHDNNETGIDSDSGKTLVEIDPNYFRPTEVEVLLGDPSLAEKKLGWKRKVSFEELISEMVKFDIENE